MQFTSQKIKKITQEGNKSSIEFYDVPPMDNIPQIDDAVFKPKGKDTIPAMLTPGEAIIPAEAVDEYPEVVAELINKGRVIQDKRDSKVPLEDPNIVHTNQNKVMQANHGGVAYANSGNLSGNFFDRFGLSTRFRRPDMPSFTGPNYEAIKSKINQQIKESKEFKEQYDQYLKNMMPEEQKLQSIVNAISQVESGNKMYDSKTPTGLTTGDAGELGAFQILPDTAADPGLSVPSIDLLNTTQEQQGEFVKNYLKGILDYLGPEYNQEDAIRAFNVGPGMVKANKTGYGSLDAAETPVGTAYLNKVKAAMSDELYKEPSIAKYLFNKGIDKSKELLNTVTEVILNPEQIVADTFKEVLPEQTFNAIKNTKKVNDLNLQFPQVGSTPFELMKKGKLFFLKMMKEDPNYEFSEKDNVILNNLEKEIVNDELIKEQNQAEFGVALQNPPQQTTLPYDDDSLNVVEEPRPIPPKVEVESSNIQLDNTESKNILKKLTDKTESSVDNNVTPPSELEAKESSEKAPEGFIGNVLSKLNDILGRALDEEALAKMAIHYTGSRMLGYSHQGSLNYSAKVAVDAMDYNQKVADAFIKKHGDDFEPASLAKYKRTHNLNDLIPISKTGIKKPVGYGFDNSKQIPIPKVELLNGKEAYLIDGQLLTYDQILAKYGSKRINIDYTSGDDAMEISKSFLSEAERQLRRIKSFTADKDLNVDVPFSQGSLADDMASYFTSLKSNYQVPAGQMMEARKAINRAANKYVDALIKYYEENDPEKFPMPSFEGMVNVETIAIPTAKVLSVNDTKNTTPLNVNLLLEQIEELIPVGTKDLTEIKVLVGGMNKAWNNSLNRFSYGKESAFNKIGWDAKLKWIYDMLTDPQEDTLKVAFTKESINKYLASNPKDDSLLDPIKGDK